MGRWIAFHCLSPSCLLLVRTGSQRSSQLASFLVSRLDLLRSRANRDPVCPILSRPYRVLSCPLSSTHSRFPSSPLLPLHTQSPASSSPNAGDSSDSTRPRAAAVSGRLGRPRPAAGHPLAFAQIAGSQARHAACPQVLSAVAAKRERLGLPSWHDIDPVVAANQACRSHLCPPFQTRNPDGHLGQRDRQATPPPSPSSPPPPSRLAVSVSLSSLLCIISHPSPQIVCTS